MKEAKAIPEKFSLNIRKGPWRPKMCPPYNKTQEQARRARQAQHRGAK